MKTFPQPAVIRRYWAFPLLGLTAVIGSGCLSSSGSSNRSATVHQGVFIDSPVTGLSYETATQNGTTDEQGNFLYQSGETVRFSIGGIDLGTAPGQAVLTPLELVEDAADSSDPAVLNLSRFLQSLDADGNLSNGIQLSTALIEAIEVYAESTPGFHLDFADTATFETLMSANDGLLAQLNDAAVFAENAQGKNRGLRSANQAWQHLQDSLAVQNGDLTLDKRPVLFVHGGAGSASQFESQAQRFIANGYPRSYLATYEYNTSPPDFVQTTVQLDAAIDALLLSTGADQVNLMGHSMGTEVSRIYLSDPERAAKVHRYVNLDGREGDSPPGGVPTLVLWGQYVDREVVGAENVYPSVEDPVGHIEVATAADSFARMYRFFNADNAPATTRIPEADGDHVWISGRANIFPANVGAVGTVLEISEVDPTTGRPLGSQPDHSQPIGEDGHWGPMRINKGGSYEFVLRRPGVANADHYFYREPYLQDNHQIRLNTSAPGTGVGALLHRSPNHTNLSISRDMELWGDQGERNDVLRVNGTNVITAQTGPLLQRLSNIFLHDRNSDGVSNLGFADPVFHAIPFMSGLDLFLPAATEPDDVIAIELISRRGTGSQQQINVPNWPSSQVRSVSVHFRDYHD